MTSATSRKTFSLAALSTALLMTLASLVVLAPPAAAARATTAKISVNQSNSRAAELVFVSGKVTTPRGAAGRARIAVQSRAPGGRYRTFITRTTARRGGFSVAHRARGTRDYRVRVLRTKAFRPSTSNVVRVRGTNKARGINARYNAVRRTVGPASGSARTATRFGRTVQYRNHRRGVLAKLGKNTSMVYGDVLQKYRDLGGVGGKLGAPISDVTCQLLESGCLQRFQNGSIYLNDRARNKVNVAYGKPKPSSFLAVAKSQRGYREPSYRGGKFNAWQGTSNAWCGFYLAWVSRASANGGAFPNGTDFAAQVRRVRNQGKTFRRPRAGAAAFFDFFGNGKPTHVALVTKVRKDGRIVTLEGNVGPSGGTDHPRGVFKFVRSTSSVLFYAMPKY